MKREAVAVVTSKESWFVPYARSLVERLRKDGHSSRLFFRYGDIPRAFGLVYILSYFRIISANDLAKHRYNFVVHESGLPKGKGWAPLFWQVLEGKNVIPAVPFEACARADSGKIYARSQVRLKGHELHDEIRAAQAAMTVKMCLDLLKKLDRMKPDRQKGKPTYYRRRTPEDGRLDIDKTIREQFNLLRIVDNAHYPAFFLHKGHRYVLKIEKAGKEKD